MLAFTIYILGVIGFMYQFLCMADRGRGVWAIGAAILWPLLILFVVGWVAYEEIINLEESMNQKIFKDQSIFEQEVLSDENDEFVYSISVECGYNAVEVVFTKDELKAAIEELEEHNNVFNRV